MNWGSWMFHMTETINWMCCLRNQITEWVNAMTMSHIGSVAHFVDVGVTRNVKGCQKQQSGRPTHFVDQHICWCGLCSVTAQFVVSVLRNDTICWCGGVFRINKGCHEEGQKQHYAQTTHFVGAFERQKNTMGMLSESTSFRFTQLPLHKSINDNQLFSVLFFHAHIPSDKKQLKDFQICFPLIMGKYSG